MDWTIRMDYWTTGLTFYLKFHVKNVRLIATSHNNAIGGEPGGFSATQYV